MIQFFFSEIMGNFSLLAVDLFISVELLPESIIASMLFDSSILHLTYKISFPWLSHARFGNVGSEFVIPAEICDLHTLAQ